VYYKPVKVVPKVDERFSEPIKALIEESPAFDYRTVAHLLGFNKNTVQRIFQIKGWQVRKRAIGMRPRIQALPSVTKAPNEAGRPMCAGSGPVTMARPRWPWSSIAIPVNCWAGTCRAAARRALRRARWSKP
jgi:hypothetical protein